MHLCQHKLPLVLIGEGKKYKDELLALAIKYNITVHIPTVFVKDEHLPAIYQQAKLFVFPGLYEGFGIPVLEAMASKTLVITSLNTSMAEIVNETECLINPLSAEDLADKIDLFLSTNQEILIEKNYNRSLEFTSQHFAKNVLALYEKFDS